MTHHDVTLEQIQQLAAGKVEALPVRRGMALREAQRPTALMPGAFNPLHVGHRKMIQFAAGILERDVAFEVSVTNVDKAELQVEEILQRVHQIPDDRTVWLTRAETFVKKARIFPTATFIVGADTLQRVGLSKYYGGNPTQRDQAIAGLRQRGIRFLVFGRLGLGHFRTVEDLDIPLALRQMCTGVSEATFRVDISSTELRKG